MTSVKIYNGEFFERKARWYIIFAGIIFGIVFVSIYYENIFGAILMIILAGGYLFMLSRTNKEVILTLKDEGFYVGEKLYPKKTLKGIVLEIEKKTGDLRNIVLIGEKFSLIYTFKDTLENIGNFLEKCSEEVPLLEDYHQSTIDKFLRKMKF